MATTATLYGKPRLAEVFIPAGTVVFPVRAKDGDGVTLRGDVYVVAERQAGGSWRYDVSGSQYECAGGCATLLKAT